MRNFLLSVFSVGALGISALAFYATHEFLSPGPLLETKTLVIPKGTGVLEMARELKREGVISDEYIFAAYSRLTQSYKRLQAGEYEFPSHIPMTVVMSKIASGDIIQRSFTIPEGKTSFEIVQILKAAEHLTGDVAQTPAEGSMLPDTYFYQTSETRESKIKLMQERMTKTVDELWAGREADLPIKTPQEALILASIVEKETGVASERKRVAGVFVNRLRIGMPLQSDPTVIYGITKGENKNEGQGPLGRRLLTTDLQTPTPYNTYTAPGLPQGPIGNPGRASIDAVLHPEKNNFLFFVADGKGGHVFAATLDEHNQNVANWRQIRKEQDGK